MGYAALVSFSVITAIDNEEEDIIASVLSDINNFFAVTWDRVKAESLVDPELQDLYSLLKYGFLKTRREIPRGLELLVLLETQGQVNGMGWRNTVYRLFCCAKKVESQNTRKHLFSPSRHMWDAF